MTVQSIASRSSSALAWTLAGAIVKVLGQLAVQITLARLLGPEAFGQFAAIVVVLSLGHLLSDGGFGAVLIQKKNIGQADVSLALGWTLLLSSVCAGLLYLLAPSLASQFQDERLTPMFRLGGLLILLHSVANISMSLLKRELDQKSIQIINALGYMFGYGAVAIVLAWLGWGGWSLLIAYAVQVLINLAAGYWLTRHTLRPRLGGEVESIWFGLKAMAAELSNWSIEYFDRFLIGKLWGLHALGYYAVAFNLSKAPVGLIVAHVYSIAFASTARLQDQREAMRKGYLLVFTAVLLLTLPLFAVISVEAAAVLHLVYGSKWIAAAPYMTALAITIPFAALGTISGAVLRGCGAPGSEFISLGFAAALIVGGLTSLSKVPLASAIWVVPLAYVVRVFVLLIALHRQLGLSLGALATAARGPIGLALAGAVAAASVRYSIGDVGTGAVGLLPFGAGLVCVALVAVSFPRWAAGETLAALIHKRMRQFAGRAAAGREL